jgi:hypothetical protein
MKFFIASFFSTLCLNSLAQIPYTDFIQNDTNIQWAAEYDQILNITPKITRYGIRNIIHEKLKNGACIDNYTTNADGAFKMSFCLKDTGLSNPIFGSNLNPYKAYYYYDRFNNLANICNETEIAPSYLENLNKNKFQIYKVKQIFYYKHNKLFINNALVTPLYLNKFSDSNERQFSWIPSFSSCFNDKAVANLSSKQKSKCVDLGESYATYRILTDEIQESQIKIFTKLHPSFSHHLFQDIVDEKITIVDQIENKIPNKKVFEVNNPMIEVPVYDDDGNVNKTIKMRNEVNIDSFYLFEIKQHFYFDSAKNILHTEVNYIDLYKRIVTNQGIDFGNAFHFRIYFINPKLYKKRPQKRYLD